VVQAAQSIALSEAIAIADFDDVAALFDDAGIEDWSWDIEDTYDNITANLEEEAVTGANEVGLVEGEVLSVDQADILLALDNFDGVYDLADTLAALTDAAEGVVEGAAEYNLTDEAEAFEDRALADALDAVEQAILAEAENAEEYQYTLADLAENFFEADELKEGVAELLAGADAVEVTDEVTQAQRVALLTEYEDATFPGGVIGNEITLVAADAGTDVSDQLSEFDDTITAEAGSLAGTTVVDPGGDSDTMTATLTQAAHIDGDTVITDVAVGCIYQWRIRRNRNIRC